MNPFLFLLEWWNLLMVKARMCFMDNLLPESFSIGLFGLLCLVRTFSSTSSRGTSVSTSHYKICRKRKLTKLKK